MTTKQRIGTAARKTATEPARAKSAAGAGALDDVMRELEAAGSAQTRKTWLRHGAKEPLFGVSFAALKTLVKRIGVDHELARALFATGNHDARMLAVKVADPAKVTPAELDRWGKWGTSRTHCCYVAMLAAESPHGGAKVKAWSAASDATLRASAWTLTGLLATLDESTPDAWFAQRLAEIEQRIHTAPNDDREAMNGCLIAIGGRSAGLRKLASAAARRIGKVEVDHGDTSCKTPDALAYIDKAWAHATAKHFASPAAQERAREPMRTRC